MGTLVGKRGSLVTALIGIGSALALAAGGCGSSNNGGGTGGQGFGSGGHVGGGGSGGGGGGVAGADGGAGNDGSAEHPADAGNDAIANLDGAGSDVAPSTLDYTFLADAEGFALDTFMNVGPYTNGNPQNLGGALDAGPLPVVGFDGTVGMPAPGSLTITATFGDFNQTVNVRRLSLSSNPAQTISLAGKTLTAQVRLDAGSTFTGTIHLFALSSPSPPRPAPGYYFAQGDSILLGDNNWHTLTFNLAVPEFAAAGFDATDIVQLGVQLASGASATSTADGGSASLYGAPQSLSIHFDTLTSN